MQICYIFKYFAIESRQILQKENKMLKATQNFLILAATIALFFSACATQSSQQSAMQMELEEKQALAELVCNERNNAEACFVVGGWLFERGINTIDDKIKQNELLDKGQKYLLKSCELNHGDGCWLFAGLLMLDEFNKLLPTNKQDDYQDIMDKISKNDLETYIHYIKKSCELDSANGCETLGDLYYWGDGVKKDEKLSFFYRKKGCDLAQTYKNKEMAGRAAEGGCIKVGRMYYNGEGVAKNKQLALKYFDRGCGVLGSNCGIYVQRFYEGYSGESIKVPQDYEFAFKLAKKGCETNNNKSCNYLGILYQKGKGTVQDFKKAFWTFYDLCHNKPDSLIPTERGSYIYIPDASDFKKLGCYNLALSYANGQGIEQNYKRAFGIFKELCDKDEMANACGIVGEYYYNAKGVRQDYREALEYFSVACDMGEQSGCDNHKMMKQSPYRHGLSDSDFE